MQSNNKSFNVFLVLAFIFLACMAIIYIGNAITISKLDQIIKQNQIEIELLKSINKS